MFSSTVQLNRLQKYLSGPLQEVSTQCEDHTHEKAISCFGTFWSGRRLIIDGIWAFWIGVNGPFENPSQYSLWQNSTACKEKSYTVSNTRRHCWQKRVIMITGRASLALNPYLQNRINQRVAFVLQIDCQSSCSISPSPASIQIELDIFERFWDFCIPALSAGAGVGLQRRESWHRWSIELANSIRLSWNLMWTQVFDDREQFWRWEGVSSALQEAPSG